LILHAIAGLEPAAGTSVFCAELCRHLAGQNWDVAITLPRRVEPGSYPVAAGVAVREFSPRLQTPRLAHVHALWNPFLHRVAEWAYDRGVPLVISPHGMLTPWALQNRAWKKAAAMLVYQHRDLSRATMLHATSREEVEDIRRLGLRQPVVIAPLGAQLPVEDRRLPPGRLAAGKPRVLLFLSRIHPKKGLDLLLEAWAKVKRESPALVAPESGRGWRVVLAGPDEDGHMRHLLSRAADLGIVARNISIPMALAPAGDTEFAFVGPVFDADKIRLFKQSDLFVLPSHSENFGVVVVESLACGVPVITTVGTPWKELEDTGQPASAGRAGWWVDVSVEALADALTRAMSLTDAERAAIGANGRWLVEHRYSWESAARIVAYSYRWLLGEAPPPPEICFG
jgi:glycosyltransferase involved in cell wall biosynthesis